MSTLSDEIVVTQALRNQRMLDAATYMKDRVTSNVLPFQIDIEKTDALSDDDKLSLQALEIEAARTAIEAVGSLAKINEVDHLGGGLGMIPSVTLTLSLMDYEKREFTFENAHASIAYYSTLAAREFLDRDFVIEKFRRGLDIAGHVAWVPGGSQLNGGRLGVMVPVAVGQALGKKAIYGDGSWVVCHCGDAGWISGQALNGYNGADLHLAPITFVMDRNGIQLSGSNRQIMNKDPRPIVEAMGLKVIEVESLYDHDKMYAAYREGYQLAQKGRPSMIIPQGQRENETLQTFAERFGIVSETEAFAKANEVPMDKPVWAPGSLMSYRDVEAMLESLFLVNELPGGKNHHDGNLKGKDMDAILANPMLQLSEEQQSMLDILRHRPKADVVTTARPARGTVNLLLSEDQLANVTLPDAGVSTSARAGVQEAYAVIAENFPQQTFVVSADLDPSTKLEKAKTFLDDEHKFEMSIEEQAAALLTNGIAMSTPRPHFAVFSTFAAFFEGIARESMELWRYQRNLNGVNEGLNVMLHMSHVGACTGRDHFSGWALDWITMSMGYLPYLHRFYTPADARSAFVAIRDAAAHYGGHMIGIPRDNLPVLSKQNGSGPLWDMNDEWEPVTEFRSYSGAENAILAVGATAFLAEEAAARLNEEGIPVDVHIINGFPMKEGQLAELISKYPYGIVTIEDGLIATRELGLRGFAGMVSSVAYELNIPLQHVGIEDPRVAPSDGHMEVWEHFGITTDALVDAIAELG